jgi:hypothetical protein
LSAFGAKIEAPIEGAARRGVHSLSPENFFIFFLFRRVHFGGFWGVEI